MQETKFYCDRCKKEISSTQLTKIKLNVGLYIKREVDWCDDCLNETNMKDVCKYTEDQRKAVEDATSQQPPTFEDLILELIQPLIEKEVNNRVNRS